MAKGKKRKKRAPPLQAPTPPSTFSIVLRSLRDGPARHPEAILISLGVVHLICFLLLFLAITAPTSVPTPKIFGADSASPAPAPASENIAPAPQSPPLALGRAVAFGAFTAALWIGALVLRGRIGSRLLRFTLFMLTPGTLLWAYAVVRLILARS